MAVLSIGGMIAAGAAAAPDRPAVTHEGRAITRAELESRSNRLARAYRRLGVRQNDFVTIALPNGIEYYETAIAVWKLGATPQPVSARLPQTEREAIVELADPSLVIGVPEGAHPGRACLPPGFEPAPRDHDGALPDRVARHWKAPTSGGSTGRPKLIVDAAPALFETDEPPLNMINDGVQLVPGPLYHNGPFSFSMRGLMHGNHLVVMSRFDAEESLRLMAEHRVDYVLLVPTMMQRIWRLGPEVLARHDLSALRGILHLAAPCPPWLKAAWIDWLGPARIWELYAGTEAQGVTWIDGDEWLQRRGSVGRVMEGFQLKILDRAGAEAPAGTVGEIYLRPDSGQGTTYHYLGAEPRASEGGWESLGDMGWLDEAGYLYLADRRTDMILSGGANIYPAEIEAALDAHAAVRSCAVIGLPDDDLGMRVHAIVDAPGGADEQDLLAFLADRLARYKIPRTLEFVAAPVRDDAGKVRRSALRAERLEAPTG